MNDLRGLVQWSRRGWGVPSAACAKREVLRRVHIGGATWVETGTYRGDTTSFLRSLGAEVLTIEPNDSLFDAACRRFKGDTKITLIKGTSEEVFASLVENVSGPVCFWLDGHYSGPGTHKAQFDTPVNHELAVIEYHLARLHPVTVLIDDFREFPSDPAGSNGGQYPTRESLVNWATRNSLTWTVEHDIFVVTSNA